MLSAVFSCERSTTHGGFRAKHVTFAEVLTTSVDAVAQTCHDTSTETLSAPVLEADRHPFSQQQLQQQNGKRDEMACWQAKVDDVVVHLLHSRSGSNEETGEDNFGGGSDGGDVDAGSGAEDNALSSCSAPDAIDGNYSTSSSSCVSSFPQTAQDSPVPTPAPSMSTHTPLSLASHLCTNTVAKAVIVPATTKASKVAAEAAAGNREDKCDDKPSSQYGSFIDHGEAAVKPLQFVACAAAAQRHVDMTDSTPSLSFTFREVSGEGRPVPPPLPRRCPPGRAVGQLSQYSQALLSTRCLGLSIREVLGKTDWDDDDDDDGEEEEGEAGGHTR